MRSRYVSVEMGRFVSEDTIGFHDNLNLYSYVSNGVIQSVDLFGYGPDGAAIGAGIGAGIGGITGGIVGGGLGGAGGAAGGTLALPGGGTITGGVIGGTEGAIIGAGVGAGIGAGVGAVIGSAIEDIVNGINNMMNEGTRGRGKSDPVHVPHVDVGRDPNGNCRPCPNPPPPWEAPGDAHGSTCGSHWHWIEYHQDPATCKCYAKRMSGPSPP